MKTNIITNHSGSEAEGGGGLPRVGGEEDRAQGLLGPARGAAQGRPAQLPAGHLPPHRDQGGHLGTLGAAAEEAHREHQRVRA